MVSTVSVPLTPGRCPPISPVMHARIACVTLAVVLAASALEHGVTCLTPQCVLAATIVQALTPQR